MNYIEYGYGSERGTPAHGYILPVLRKMLIEGGAKTIFDVGCGNGSLTIKLLELGYNAYGIDASEQGIEQANNQYPGRFYCVNVNDEYLPEELKRVEFDTVISIEVIEHLYLPGNLVTFARRVLDSASNGGNFIVSTPYHGYWKNLGIALLGKFDEHFTAMWDGGHIKFWSKDTLSKLLREGGFQVLSFRGAGRLPYLWKSMLMSARINMNEVVQ